MKQFVILFSLLCVFKTKAQQDSIKSPYWEIKVEQLSDDYSVASISDTSYAKILRLGIQDITKVDSVLLELESLDGSVVASREVKLITQKDFLTEPCKTAMCAYMPGNDELIIYIGKFSFTRKYNVRLSFNKYPEFTWTRDF